MWSKYRILTFNPQVPSALLGTTGVYFRLGRRYSRLYVGQVMSAVAKLVCVRPACQLPMDLKSIKDHLWDRPPKDDRRREVLTSVKACGAYWAWFVPIGKTFRQLYNLGHWGTFPLLPFIPIALFMYVSQLFNILSAIPFHIV